MNNPSYSNLGGSGSRCSPLFSAAASNYAVVAAGPPKLIRYNCANAFLNEATAYLPADVGNRLVIVEWSDGSAHIYACQIAACTSSTITLNETTSYLVSGTAATLPTSGTITIKSGGPFLITASSTGGVGWGSGWSSYPGPEELLDGMVPLSNAGHPYIENGNQAGFTTIFDFGTLCGVAMQKIITEVTIIKHASSNLSSLVWIFEASNDNFSTHIDVSAQFSLGVTDIDIIPLTATSGYRYYRWRCISGTATAETVRQILFKIDDYSATDLAVMETPMATIEDAEECRALQDCYRIGASPNQQPDWLVYCSDFSKIKGITSDFGWDDIQGGCTLTADYIYTRIGDVSLRVNTGVGKIAFIRDNTGVNGKPIDLSNTTAILNLAVLVGDVVQPPDLYIYDTAGKYMIVSLCSLVPSPRVDGCVGFKPRYSGTISTSQFSDNSTQSGFDITKVNMIYVRTQNYTNPFTVVFDSLFIVKNLSRPQLAIRNDAASGLSPLMFLEWLNEKHPGIKVSVSLNPTYLSTDIRNGCNAVGDYPDGYGVAATAYRDLCNAGGHGMTNYVHDQGLRPQHIDFPLSQHSLVGTIVYNQYYMDGFGYQPRDMRVVNNGTWGSWNPAMQKAISPYVDISCAAIGPAGTSAFASDYLFSGINTIDTLATPITGVYATDIANGWGSYINPILDAVANNGRHCMFTHLQETEDSSGWGANWTTSRGALSQWMALVTHYLAPAMAGAPIAGLTIPNQVPAIFITQGQWTDTRAPVSTDPGVAYVMETVIETTLPNIEAGTTWSIPIAPIVGSTAQTINSITYNYVLNNGVALTRNIGYTPTLTSSTLSLAVDDGFVDGDVLKASVTVVLSPSGVTLTRVWNVGVSITGVTGVWSYLTASADVLGLSTMGGWLRSLLSTSTVNVTSLSVVTQSDMEIVSGDAYDTTTNQSITFADDKTWPVLSPTNTVCVVAPLSNPLSTLFTATCTVSGNSPAQVIYIPFTAAQTSLLVPGNVYYHKVKTILSNTEVRTLVLGQITVK